MSITGFEDHCWRDVIPPETLAVYNAYARETFVGRRPALLAIDLYNLVYEGGPKQPLELMTTNRSACGIYAYEAIGPTQQLFEFAREAGLPIFYTTNETRIEAGAGVVTATKRRTDPRLADAYEIREEFKPRSGDVVIYKERASAFFGTPLVAHLTQRGIDSLIVCGESTSGCVRASSVDAYSLGYHVSIVEECVFDRSPIVHKVNLFDLHHKYADVMTLAEVQSALEASRTMQESRQSS